MGFYKVIWKLSSLGEKQLGMVNHKPQQQLLVPWPWQISGWLTTGGGTAVEKKAHFLGITFLSRRGCCHWVFVSPLTKCTVSSPTIAATRNCVTMKRILEFSVVVAFPKSAGRQIAKFRRHDIYINYICAFKILVWSTDLSPFLVIFVVF